MKCDVFKTEINYIKSVEHRKIIENLLNNLPDYFYEIPASSTGKYHPSFSLGDGGLVRHTKVAVRIAKELLDNNVIGTHSFNNNDKDLIIMALLLHDGFKSGKIKEKYTRFDHPILASNYVLENNELKEDEKKLIANMIASHMGEWNTSDYSDITLPLPSNKYERFVHMCDYLSAKKFLDVKFEQNEIVE